MSNINKTQLTELIAKNNNCSKKTAEEAIDMFTRGIESGLSGAAEKITLIGFGTFYKQHRKATKGRNPRTGESLDIPASVLPKFKAGQSLKKACN